MKRKCNRTANSLALVTCVIALAGIGCRPSGHRTQQPEPLPDDASSIEQFAKVHELISSGLQERNIPSVSIAVARKGHVIWEQSFGWADRENQLNASPDTVYSLASTTKPMIATGLMVLVQAGKVDLDDPVEQYIGPGLLTVYEGHAKEITVRQLLHHTAGLPVHFNYYYVDEPSRPLPLLETIQRFGIIVQQPGEEFCYANLGYALVGHIIARVSGRPLAEFMSEEIYRPLGMTGALFDPDIDAFKRIATMYDGSGEIAPFKTSDTPGASHGYASVRDLLRFGMFHLKAHLRDQVPILDDAAIDLMQTEKDGALHHSGSEESYGLGWFFDDTSFGVRTVWHEGGWTGASAMLKLLPSEDIAVAVLMNVYDTDFVNQVAEATLQAMLPDYGELEGQMANRVAESSSPSFDLPVGRYSGGIITSKGTVPLILEMKIDGELDAYLGEAGSSPQRVRSAPRSVPRLPAQILASFPGPTGDQVAARHDHVVWLDLRYVSDELRGTASAMTLGGHRWKGIDDQRMRFHLPYRLSLTRTN